MQKVTINDIGGVVAKEDGRYTVKDNAFGNNLITIKYIKKYE